MKRTTTTKPIRNAAYAAMLLAGLMFSIAGRAQSIPYSQVMTELALIRNNFVTTDSTSFVSCQVAYYYSMESTPTNYLDSLFGQYKMTAGTHLYMKLGNTETIQGDTSLAVLYNNDSTMMVGRPNPANPVGPTEESLFMLDSGFVAYNVSAITLTTQAGLKTMVFTFTDSSRYYNCKLVYDSATYMPKSLSYILRSSKMAEAGQPVPDGAQVTIFISGFSRSPFDTSLLNMNRYFTIGADGTVTLQPAYNNYNLVQTADFQQQP